jgi:FAD/FMN-containing dehydrogenase
MTIEDKTVNALREQLSGDALAPGDAGYDLARRIQNGLIDRRPTVIARCLGTADVQAAVRFGRERGLEIAIRGGGHNVAGNAVCDGGLMIDLSAMRAVHVDPRARRARAQGGATWRDYDRETQLQGLASTGGTVSMTGVAGLTLGGGLGWLMGKYGLAVDNLRALEVVTASGDVLTASADEHPDLFWAFRGGGGNSGSPWFDSRGVSRGTDGHRRSRRAPLRRRAGRVALLPGFHGRVAGRAVGLWRPHPCARRLGHEARGHHRV